jgi:leader peptidase (prepilin peptidase)/N-methyltransferase
MEWWSYLPVAFWCLLVFAFGLAVGSFLNVLIARLPLEKSIVWPSSRCFTCFTPIRFADNIPVLGYLRLRGRCRACGAAFSSRYLWVEVGTGLAFLALYVFEVLANGHGIAAFKTAYFALDMALPSWRAGVMFVYHSVLLACLIAAAVIDAEHRIIPPAIPYTGLAVGLLGGALMPWPWPNPAAAGVLPVSPELGPDAPWSLPDFWGKVPPGVQPWPFWGPAPAWAPPGSWQLGLLTSVAGALAGSLAVRLIKGLFELGFGREALGLGDADLLMMAGAFLGWQIAVLSLFTGAVMALVLKVLGAVLVRAKPGPAGADARELPFGPGLALGVVVTWLSWRWVGPHVQFPLFDLPGMGLVAAVMGVGVFAAGLLLRRPAEPVAAAARV